MERAGVRCDQFGLQEPLPEDGSVEAALTALLRAIGAQSRERRCVIQVHEPWCQQRVLGDLPRVSRRAALRIVQLDAGRQFRGREPVVVDGSWRSGPDGERAFVAVAVPERLLQQLGNVCAAAGWSLQRAEPAEGAHGLRWVPMLRQQQQARRWRRIGVAAWLGAACVLLGSAWVTYTRLDTRRAALAARARVLAPQVARLESVERERDRLQAEVRALEGSARTDRVLARAAHLLAALPDSAYLSRVLVRDTGAAELSGGAYRVSAVAAAATRTRLPVMPASLSGVGPDPHRRGWTAFTLRTERDGW